MSIIRILDAAQYLLAELETSIKEQWGDAPKLYIKKMRALQPYRDSIRAVAAYRKAFGHTYPKQHSKTGTVPYYRNAVIRCRKAGWTVRRIALELALPYATIRDELKSYDPMYRIGKTKRPPARCKRCGAGKPRDKFKRFGDCRADIAHDRAAMQRLLRG